MCVCGVEWCGMGFSCSNQVTKNTAPRLNKLTTRTYWMSHVIVLESTGQKLLGKGICETVRNREKQERPGRNQRIRL